MLCEPFLDGAQVARILLSLLLADRRRQLLNQGPSEIGFVLPQRFISTPLLLRPRGESLARLLGRLAKPAERRRRLLPEALGKPRAFLLRSCAVGHLLNHMRLGRQAALASGLNVLLQPGGVLAIVANGVRIRRLIAVPRRVYERCRVVVGVQVPMQAGRLVDLAEERVLGEESSELGIEVAGLGVVEAGFGVEDVSGEGEAVGAVGQLAGETEVAPGILGNPKTPLPHDETPTHRFSRRRLRWGRRAP